MMNLKIPVLVVACAMVLSACSNNASTSNQPAAAGTAPPPAVAAPATSMGGMATAPAAGSSAALPGTSGSSAAPGMSTATTPMASGASGKPAAVVTNCSTVIEGNDAMQYDVGSITVPSSCTNFKITLKHTGKLPVSAMGHDVVITKQSDMEAVDKEGAAAGLKNGYLKDSDPRIIAHTKLIGAGETTSVSFPTSKIKTGGPYEFFCSFPGHSTTMHGTISVQ